VNSASEAKSILYNELYEKQYLFMTAVLSAVEQ